MANGNGRVGLLERVKEAGSHIRTSQLWSSIFRPGSPFRAGYNDSPRNRSYVIMNNVLYHLHPVKVKRHGVRLSYTLCLGGLSFFLFILLTITGIFLMFYYRPTSPAAFQDIQALSTNVAFGSLVRNLHRWAAHAMIITVWLHQMRVFMTGSYKPPREFNWNIGVILLLITMLLSFTGYLLPDDQLGFWAVTVGTNMARATPIIGHEGPFGPELGFTAFNDVRFALLGGSIVDANALLRAYIWHCVGLPLIGGTFMIVHFWRIRKDGSISGPAPVMLESEVKNAKGRR